MAPRPFLTASWLNLAILSWPVDAPSLRERLPPELELDTLDGRAFVSLVAFDFRGCLALGRRVPGCVDFPEINLRFYVRERESGRRGVMFLREYVPSRLVAFVARAVYNEPYRAAPMRSESSETGDRLAVRHTIRAGGREHSVEVLGEGPATIPDQRSEAHWFKEHEWGYGVGHLRRTLRYRVEHPLWETRAVTSAKIEADFGALYGDQWGWLGATPPASMVLARGSAVSVFSAAALSRDASRE